MSSHLFTFVLELFSEPQSGSCNFDWGDTCGYDLGTEKSGWHLEDPRYLFFWPDYSTGSVLGKP